jgi:hypothetical protein
MPGSAVIYGLMPCTNARLLDSTKTKSWTYDAELFIGLNEDHTPQTIEALLHFFTPVGEKDRQADELYLVCGRIGGITSATAAGEGHPITAYDLEIQAFSMDLMPSFLEPVKPTLSITGPCSQQISDKAFHIDVTQYILSQPSVSSFHVAFPPPSNLRFNRLNAPRPGVIVTVIGYITGIANRPSAPNEMKRLPVELIDLSFAVPIPTPTSTPTKAKPSKWAWGQRSDQQLPSSSTNVMPSLSSTLSPSEISDVKQEPSSPDPTDDEHNEHNKQSCGGGDPKPPPQKKRKGKQSAS